MATKSYIGVGDVAEEISHACVGVNGVAKRVKKIYIGVNGIAKKVFDLFGVVTSNNKTTVNLTFNADQTSSAKNNKYVLFGGGEVYSGSGSAVHNNIVNAFDENLIRSVPTALQSTIDAATGASCTKYAIISSTSYLNSYDATLSRTLIDTVLTQNGAPGGQTKNHLIFAFRGSNTNASGSLVTTAYDKTTQAQTSVIGLSYANSTNYDPTTVSTLNGVWHIFGCGTGKMQRYDVSLTKLADVSNPCTSAIRRQAIASTIDYVIGVGGDTGSYSSPVSNAFSVNKSGTISSLNQITSAVSALSGAGSNGYCVFGGGKLSGTGYSTNATYIFDNSLTRVTAQLSNPVMYNYGSIGFKDYLMMSTGRSYTSSTNTDTNTVNVWNIAK